MRNNGGGHYNHSLFWKILGKGSKKLPEGQLFEAISDSFGSYEKFLEVFNKAAETHFGSGWAWLSVDEHGKLVVHSTLNQDTPLSQNLRPILGLDVWEHAYYLKYQNRRPEYVASFWNVLNWAQVEENYSRIINEIGCRAIEGPYPTLTKERHHTAIEISN